MATIDEIKAMVESGMSMEAIAEELGESVGRVTQIVRAMGLGGSAKRKSALTRLTREQISEAIEMYGRGVSVLEIIERFDLNYTSFYKLLRDEGVGMRERGEEGKEIRKDRIDLAVKMYVKGESLYTIEIETGIRQPVLHGEIHRRGIPLRRKRRVGVGGSKIRDEDDDLFDVDMLTDRELEILSPEDDLRNVG